MAAASSNIEQIRSPNASSVLASPQTTLRLAWVAAGVSLSGLIYAYSRYPEIFERLDLRTTRTVASAVLLIGLTGLYFHASKFYRDQFYLFVSLFWLSNLVYLVFDLGSPTPGSVEYPRFRSMSMLLAIVSDLPLYIASTIARRGAPTYKNTFLPLVVILFWFGVEFSVSNPHISSTIHTLLATTFATYVAFRIYRSFRSRIETASRWSNLLGYTFFAYAAITPTFLFVLFEPLRFLVKHIMSVALLIKLVNGVALAIMLRDDFGQFRADAERAEDQLKQRSELEDLGLLTAGIEHELRTPLGAMYTQLDEMKEQYQKDAEILPQLKLLDAQRLRILAATRIINTLRTSQELFSQNMDMVKVADLVRKSIKNLQNEEGLITDAIIFKIVEYREQLFTRAHPSLLEQAFVNILKNSVESIGSVGRERGAIKVEIGVPRNSPNQVFVRFQDNGPGFQVEHMDKLTRPNFSTRRDKKANSGLGLFVCERIIRLHDGELSFENVEKNGAVVIATLPRVEPKRALRQLASHAINRATAEDVR